LIDTVTAFAATSRFRTCDARGWCLDGENACPPEDCGGAPGYAALLEALADRAHPDHDEFTRWFGGPLDPHHFDLAEVNVELQRLARS
jgi:hypothetical protein